MKKLFSLFLIIMSGYIISDNVYCADTKKSKKRKNTPKKKKRPQKKAVGKKTTAKGRKRKASATRTLPPQNLVQSAPAKSTTQSSPPSSSKGTTEIQNTSPSQTPSFTQQEIKSISLPKKEEQNTTTSLEKRPKTAEPSKKNKRKIYTLAELELKNKDITQKIENKIREIDQKQKDIQSKSEKSPDASQTTPSTPELEEIKKQKKNLIKKQKNTKKEIEIIKKKKIEEKMAEEKSEKATGDKKLMPVKIVQESEDKDIVVDEYHNVFKDANDTASKESNKKEDETNDMMRLLKKEKEATNYNKTTWGENLKILDPRDVPTQTLKTNTDTTATKENSSPGMLTKIAGKIPLVNKLVKKQEEEPKKPATEKAEEDDDEFFDALDSID